ncbi:hypothetical protein AALP_AA7G055700 [Arabis alpina]|uniref:Retrotransposon gag domain-containing protein n=1 Tax=Arabis alpina TaxID=50452 RepID=A0A087GG39_ARAAL|nr:hypothetical protein AALP_AA7G055700 [Arabis alpina]
MSALGGKVVGRDEGSEVISKGSVGNDANPQPQVQLENVAPDAQDAQGGQGGDAPELEDGASGAHVPIQENPAAPGDGNPEPAAEDLIRNLIFQMLDQMNQQHEESVVPKFVTHKPTWMEFRMEFEKNYFPTEAKDRLEIQFLELKQRNRSVREYKAEFTQAASLNSLMERAMDVEEGISDEQEDSMDVDSVNLEGSREQGDYAISCLNKHPSSYGPGKTFVGSTPTSYAGEPPVKRQAVDRVYNLEVEDTPKPPCPSNGPIVGGGSGEQYPDEQIGQEEVAQEQVVREIFASRFEVFNISPSLSDEKSLDSMRRVTSVFMSRCLLIVSSGSRYPISSLVPHPPAPPLTDLPSRDDLRRIRAGNHRWDDLTYSRICRARGRLDTWDSEYWAAEMRGTTPGIHAFNTPLIPIRPKKSRRLFEVSSRSDAEVTVDPYAIVVIQDSKDTIDDVYLQNHEEIPPVKDGSQKIPSATDGRGKVDAVDKKAEKKRIAAKAKADLEAGRIPAFRIGGTCEILPSEALVARSLGVTPPASLLVMSDNAAIRPCSAVQTAVNVPQLLPPPTSLTTSSTPASELSSESSLSKRRRTC